MIAKLAAVTSCIALTLCGSVAAVAGRRGESAEISESNASAIALARVPGGRVKSHELETENGRLIWTYDIARPSAGGVTEVHVDARSGKVISIKRETPSQEAAEAKHEKDMQR